MSCSPRVIPREGVEIVDRETGQAIEYEFVIPREGVEMSSHVRPPTSLSAVIPREGVEIIIITIRLSCCKVLEGCDPERGS